MDTTQGSSVFSGVALGTLTPASRWNPLHSGSLEPKDCLFLHTVPVLRTTASHFFLVAQNRPLSQQALLGAVYVLGAAEAKVITVGIVSKPKNVMFVPRKGFCSASGFKKWSGTQHPDARMLEFGIFGFLWE